MKYYRNSDNRYLGAFDDLSPVPEGAVEVPAPPADRLMRWDGAAWNYLTYAQYQTLNTHDGWVEYCQIYKKDYKFYRETLKSQMIPAWESLSADDKKKCVKACEYPSNFTQQDIDALFTAAEQLANWQAIVKGSVVARHDRWYAAARTASFYITEVQSFDLYTSTLTLSAQFIDIGSPALHMWMINGAYAPLGIDYTTNGFAQKAYYSADLKNLIVGVIVNGNYVADQEWEP